MSEDSFDYGDELDDEDLIAAVEAAEKARGFGDHALKQSVSVNKQQQPIAETVPLSRQPMSQASQRAQSVAAMHARPPLADRTQQRASVPPPQPRLRLPRRPVYKDDFPDVRATSNGTYAVRNEFASTSGGMRSTNEISAPQLVSAAELGELRRKLAEAEEKFKEKERIFNTTSGEISVLRNNVTKAQKEHQAELQEQQAKNLALQEQVSLLQRASKEEKKRYESEILFARQEHESAVRHSKVVSQHPNTVRRTKANGISGGSQPVKAKAMANPPTKKGFVNSFFSPPRILSEKARLPSSPAEGGLNEEDTEQYQLPSKDKDNRAAPGEDESDSSNDNSKFGAELQDTTFDAETTVEASRAHTSVSSRQAFIAYCFAHQSHHPDGHSVKSMQCLINLNEQDIRLVDAASDGAARYRELSAGLFDILGEAAQAVTSAGDLEQQDRAFMSRMCSIVLRLLSLYSEANISERVLISLNLLRDIFDTFRSNLCHQANFVGQHTSMLLLLIETLAAVTNNQKVIIDAAREAENSKGDGRINRYSTLHVHNFNRPKVGDSAAIIAERQAQPIFEAVIDFLALLAWSPDQDCIKNFDVVLKDKELFPLLLHSSRPLSTIRRCLQLLCLLSSQNALFRTIMAIPMEQNLSRPPQKPQLAFVEAISAFIMYKAASADENWALQRLSLVILSTLATEHPDGVPLLGQSSVLVQRMIVRISLDVSKLYDAVEAPSEAGAATRMVQHVAHTLLLLHFILLSKAVSRRLSDHLLDRPYSRDYFVAGIGRIAFADPPAWLTDMKDTTVLENAANVAHELLADVLTPDELDELYVLCRDEEDDDMDDDEAEAQSIANLVNDNDDDEAVANALENGNNT